MDYRGHNPRRWRLEALKAAARRRTIAIGVSVSEMTNIERYRIPL
jgi:hypothetical protein